MMLGWICARIVPLGFLLAAGCSAIVEAEFPDIEVTRPGIQVPSAPSSSQSSVTFSFSFDSTKLGANTNLEAQSRIVAVKLHQLQLKATRGISNFPPLQTLHILAYVPLKSSSTESMRQVEIADYVGSGAAKVGSTFTVPLPEPVDLLPLVRPSSLESRKIVVVVNLGGQMPSESWEVDVSMSISVKIQE
jgi:hypothetical protein